MLLYENNVLFKVFLWKIINTVKSDIAVVAFLRNCFCAILKPKAYYLPKSIRFRKL